MSDPTATSFVTTPGAEPAQPLGLPPDAEVPGAKQAEKPRGLIGDAWHDLRRKPLFWVSSAFIVLFLVMAAWPSLFTNKDPSFGLLERSLEHPSSQAWFGYDVQGRDMYARVIYGAQASIVVALLATLGTTLLGGLLGVISGYRGRWFDSVLSRVADVFFGLPFLLGAIVILFTFNPPGADLGKWQIIMIVTLSLIVLSWPVSMRIMRSSVLGTKEADYIVAARAMGASSMRIVFKHLIPNCLAPLLVYSTILIGSFIGAEATLAFLGVGLRSPVVSWGILITESQNYIRVAPYLLLFPAAFLVAAVLAFVVLGEAVREALDPKLR